MPSRPVVIGFDGSPAAKRALQEAADLFAPRPALVVVVWEAGYAYDLADLPIGLLETPPTTVDIRTAMQLDEAMYDTAQQLAERGAAMAAEAGLDAQGLAVADDVTVADTLIRIVKEHDAQVLVVGAHGHSSWREVLLGGTTRELVHRAPCPVLVVRADEPAKQPGH
jgi:nucleotide-binding universal stress UspA family protein